MRKITLKKMLAIALCLMMTMSALSLFAGATTAPTFAKTIYMKSTGVDTNDGLTQTTPVKTLEKASELVGEDGGEIVVLDDMVQDISAYETNGGHKIYMAKSNATIYIHGVSKGGGEYTSLRFGGAVKWYSAQTRSIVLNLNGPVAFYDIVLGTECESSVAADSSFSTTNGVLSEMWISANGYPLTIGNNVSCKFSYPGTTKGDGSAINITAGRHSANSRPLNANADFPNVINIFSGNLGNIFASSYADGTGQTGDSTVNIMGGTMKTLYTKRCDDNGVSKTDAECNFTVNYYGGTIAKITGADGDTSTHTLNLMGKTKTEATGIAEYTHAFANGGKAVINESVQGATPTFFAASNFKAAPAAPPVFDEDPDLNKPSDTEADTTKPDETKAPETTAADETEAAEDGGCGSVIGISTIAVVAVIGTAVAVTRKKED